MKMEELKDLTEAAEKVEFCDAAFSACLLSNYTKAIPALLELLDQQNQALRHAETSIDFREPEQIDGLDRKNLALIREAIKAYQDFEV